MALAAKECGIEELYVPMENAKEASLAEGLTVYGVSNVKTLVEHLSGEKTIEPIEHWEPEETPRIMYDFADVKSQSFAKRAMEIAAAGGHNILLIGPPGAGKSMLAQRLPSILPPLSKEEAMEVAKIYSIMGMLSEKEPLVRICPFRSPHHTISAPGLTGGGSTPRPGEITLAHNGVLFLDELPEFHRDALEVLRQPMEEGKVSIVRVSGTEVFPSRFMMVCAMNPCKCGWFGDPSGRCRCSENAVSRYIGKISGPLLDRMDLVVQVPSLSFREVSYELPSEPSSEIQKRVVAAREVQRERYKGTNTRFNAVMEPAQMRKWCALDEAGTQLMKDAFDVMNLTARSYDRVLRVARTIADLDGSENITEMHIAEAVQYRNYKLEVPGK